MHTRELLTLRTGPHILSPMKKALLSALASGVVIPGLGQVLNHHLKKGLALLVITLGLFVALLGHLYSIMNFMIRAPQHYPFTTHGILDAFRDCHPGRLYAIVIVFFGVWVYSIVDAFVFGIKRDNEDKRDGKQ